MSRLYGWPWHRGKKLLSNFPKALLESRLHFKFTWAITKKGSKKRKTRKEIAPIIIKNARDPLTIQLFEKSVQKRSIFCEFFQA